MTESHDKKKIEDFRGEIEEASDILDHFVQGTASESADLLGRIFEHAGSRISRALAHSAQTGKLSLRRLSSDFLKDASALAINNLIKAPLSNFLQTGLGIRSQPAHPVFGGQRYGKYENRPFGSGNSGANRTGSQPPSMNALRGEIHQPVTVNVHLGAGADARSIQQSEGQISAALTRAVRNGQRYL